LTKRIKSSGETNISLFCITTKIAKISNKLALILKLRQFLATDVDMQIQNFVFFMSHYLG